VGDDLRVAAVTDRLRLGSLVAPVTFRHPAVLTKLVATADRISGGRIDVGIGSGWHAREHEVYQFPFPSLRERMAMLERQLRVLHEQSNGERYPGSTGRRNTVGLIEGEIVALGGSSRGRRAARE
jgi:alkanesulfonate monooxygenase SsuD/methylene tetrahydromethanopterin reductase-like flavin-dependent oxidoreductase (luciferase family)